MPIHFTSLHSLSISDLNHPTTNPFHQSLTLEHISLSETMDRISNLVQLGHFSKEEVGRCAGKTTMPEFLRTAQHGAWHPDST